MDGDRPITQRKDDRLGFSEIADRLASALVDQSAPEGLVFGIEGKWGSGKSSLINLTIEALKSRGAAAPEVISFSPWLIGDCDVLLRSLFDELANAAVKIDPIEAALTGAETSKSRKNVAARNSHWKLQQKVRIRNALGKKLKTFGSVAGTIGKLARVAGTFGVPAGELVGTALERGASAAKDLKESAPLSKLKSELVDALRLLSRRIAVFIDDLDRLEPREAAEVLRLIRAVADFPNVIYVLSYDPDVIANILMKAVQVDDGAAFLEKIVQVSFRIPKPEAFDLRRWFQAEVCQMFSAELDVGSAQSEATQRLAEVIDIQGDRYLETGRDVTRVLNALRLHALPVRTLIDIPDMVWLQLVRIGNAKFYEWIEDYVTEIAAAVSGARVTDGAPETMARRLEQILKEEGLDVDRSIMELGEVLPGIDPGIGGGLNRDVRRVFNNLGKQSINAFVASRRLGSPQHYRYYFAFSHPAGALPDEQVQAFIESAERAPSDAIQMFIDLADVSRPQGARWLKCSLSVWSHHLIASPRMPSPGYWRPSRAQWTSPDCHLLRASESALHGIPRSAQSRNCLDASSETPER
jgi:hypothetical protein